VTGGWRINTIPTYQKILLGWSEEGRVIWAVCIALMEEDVMHTKWWSEDMKGKIFGRGKYRR
jgi:hypothetical protein